MTDTQKTIAVAAGVAVFLGLALGVGILCTLFFASARSPVVLPVVAPPRPVTSTIAAPGEASASVNMLSRLLEAQSALQRAHDALRKASVNNHGGFVQKARVSADVAQRDLASALSYLAEHPEITHAAAGSAPSIHAATIPDYDAKPDGTYGSPNLAHAIIALDEALAPFLVAAPNGDKLISEDLGGLRDQVLGDIDQTNQYVLAAYEYAHKGGDAGAPNGIPVAPEAPATAPATKPMLP